MAEQRTFQDILEGIGDFSSFTLETSPSMAYFSSAPFQGRTSPAQQRYWEGEYGNVTNEYLGALGTALRTQTEAPSFVDFLGNMPWTERYTALSPNLRPGSGFRRFNPQTQHVYR